MNRLAAVALTAFLSLGLSSSLLGHCEIPCGIYDDHARIHMIEENCTTVEKAMNEIERLSGVVEGSGATSHDYNQLIRWTVNKEEHATKIQEIVWQYFMTQRIKPDQADYEKKLKLLHGMLLEAMKSKQTVDTKHVANLREHLADFEKLYFAE